MLGLDLLASLAHSVGRANRTLQTLHPVLTDLGTYVQHDVLMKMWANGKIK